MTTLSPDLLRRMHAWWRAANYLSVGQIYLRANPLLEEPLSLAHIKPRLLGHWGTTPGLNFVYVHLNRLIKDHDLDMINIIGPGHGGPGWWQHLPRRHLQRNLPRHQPGPGRHAGPVPAVLVALRHSQPRGAGNPGSIHEGGELGYSLAHAYGAAFDNPDLIVACIVGDGEAETGALATSWHSNKFLNPARDGAVLPILHLNGYKIANPPCWRASATPNSPNCSAATATSRILSSATSRWPCTNRWPPPSTPSSPTSAASRPPPAPGAPPHRHRARAGR
jgi:xylulose-5-phosphate/fructose-6-phosphate phosphoketolase